MAFLIRSIFLKEVVMLMPYVFVDMNKWSLYVMLLLDALRPNFVWFTSPLGFCQTLKTLQPWSSLPLYVGLYGNRAMNFCSETSTTSQATV